MAMRLVRPERFDVSSWSFANETPAGEELAPLVAAEIRDRFLTEAACDSAFGATVADEIEAEATDLVITLPFELTEDDWAGPLLVVSLEDIVQEQIDELDSTEGGVADPDDLAELRDGLLALAQKLDDALGRNAAKMTALNKRESPMW
jgi:hypothetical protein